MMIDLTVSPFWRLIIRVVLWRCVALHYLSMMMYKSCDFA